MNTIPLINNAPSTNFSMNKLNAVNKSGVRSAPVNDAQLRQEVNTSIVALKREAFSLETLINQAAQELINLNNRIAAIEQAEGDYVKKSDVVDTVSSGNMNPITSNAVAGAISALDVSNVGGSGKYISAISETDGKISATASNLATSVTNGDNSPVTSGAVASALNSKLNWTVNASPASASYDISNLDRGAYLIFASDIYTNYNRVYIGVLCNYDSTRKALFDVLTTNLRLQLNSDLTALVPYNGFIYNIKMLCIGYN